MNRYRSAPPGRTPQPDVVHSQRGAFPAGPSSNPRPDVIGYQRGAYPTFASSPSTTTSHFQQAQHAASPYTAPPPNVAHLQRSQHSGSRYPAQVPSLRDVRHEFTPRPLPQSPPQPRALDTHYDHHAATPRPAPRPDPSEIQPSPHFIIVGLFALRLTLRLVSRLDTYPQRTADVRWLETFLAPYPAEYALAKVSGASKEEYVTRYPDIVGRMKCQPMYPVVFMGMNPDKSRQKTGEMTDRRSKSPSSIAVC